LLGNDLERAATAMTDFGRAVGRLHATTLRRRADHESMLAEFGPTDVTTGGNVGTDGPQRWREVEQACTELRFPDARIARDDIAHLCAQLEDPGRFAGLVHRDLNPTNVLVTDDGVRLVDFEGCGFGHVGVDASFVHYPFPHYSAHWAVLPDAVTHAADSAYRESLAHVLGDDALQGYDEMLAVGASAALASRVTRLPLLARTDQSSHDSWRRRAQLVQQVEVFTRLANRASNLHALSRWFRDLAAAMAGRWADATTPPPPLFPAFAD
jgi:hypothetical protein